MDILDKVDTKGWTQRGEQNRLAIRLNERDDQDRFELAN